MSIASYEDTPAWQAGVARAKAAMAEADNDDLAPWVERIRPHLARSVESIVAAGRELTAAKAELPHGRWHPLLNELRLSARWATKYMRAAELAKSEVASDLPAKVDVLDVLARLDEDELADAIEQGEVTPSTTRVQAVEVVKHRQPQPPLTRSPTWR